MKTNVFTSVIIFISAYSPLALIIAIQDFKGKNYRYDSINEAIQLFNNPFVTWTIVGISIISLGLLWYVMRNIERGHLITIKSISNRSSELVNYTIPYMISFFGFDLFNVTELVSFLIFITLLCIFTIKKQAIFINPILAIAGYGNYDIEYEENGIEKDGVFLSKIKPRKGHNYQIQKITDYSFLITKDITNG